MRVGREVVVFAMFEDEDAIGLQQSAIYHQVGHGRQFWQRIGWIGKDQVKRLVTRLDKAEHIATDEDMVLGAYLLDTLLDEACMIAIFLHTHNPLATTRKQFERDASRAREKVECCRFVKIEIATDDIE